MELSGEPVRAAGGIVWREQDGGVEVLLVHRPAYDDWTFPKGKADDGETDEACALREVEEETGLSCAIERELGETRYIDPKGRPKVVRWYVMRPLRGEFVPHQEIDAARWLQLDAAGTALTYDHDRGLLESFAASA